MKEPRSIHFTILFCTVFNIVFCVGTFAFLSSAQAADVDESLAESLKIEANHNLNRIKSYKGEAENNKVFENEREKGLGEFFEDQEKWDLIRERGLRDYLKQKRVQKSYEGSPEHQQYLKETAEALNQYEKGRSIYVTTRNKIRSQQTQEIAQLEKEEFQLKLNRPRYDLQKRNRNKWVTASGSKMGGGSSSSSGGYQNSNIQNNYPPPTQDYSNAPSNEGFDTMPPPPVYDNVPYDPSFGGDMSIPPPPPPPPPDYDF